MTIVFENSFENIPKEGTFTLKFRPFLHQILQIKNFEGTDFKYDNSFFQIPAQKYRYKAYF